MSGTPRELTCERCGWSFFSSGPRAKYCPECRQKRWAESMVRYLTNGAMRKHGSIDRCAICGKEYIVKGGSQKYCPDCRNGAMRDSNSAAARKRPKIKPESAASRYCIVCGNHIQGKRRVICASPDCKREYLRRKQAESRARRKKDDVND